MKNTYSKSHFIPFFQFNFDFNHLKIIIETERLLIKSYDDQDFENCVLLYGDKILTKYFDHGQPRSRKETEQLIQEKGKQYFDKGLPFGLFSVFNKKDKNFMGQVDLIPTNEHGTIEIGFILHKKYHNQGFCQEAIKSFLFYFIDEINLKFFKNDLFFIKKVIATVHPKNFASIRMIKLVGMLYEKSENRFNSSRLWYSYKISNYKLALG